MNVFLSLQQKFIRAKYLSWYLQIPHMPRLTTNLYTYAIETEFDRTLSHGKFPLIPAAK
jgi:hypothetical protein